MGSCSTFTLIGIFIYSIKSYSDVGIRRVECVDFLLMVAIIGFAFLFLFVEFPDGIPSFLYLRKCVVFSLTLMLLFVVRRMPVNRKIVMFIITVNVLMGVYYSYSYFLGEGREYLLGTRLLTFKFGNPNFTGMWLAHTFFAVFMAMVILKRIMLRILLGVLLIILSSFLYETYARTSILAVVFFLIMASFVLLKDRVRLNNIIIAIIIIMPIAAVIAYENFLASNVAVQLEMFTVPGKMLESREDIWRIGIEMIGRYPITGAYYQISEGSGQSQMHNTHLDVLASYGGIVFILFLIFWTRIIQSINRECNSKFQVLAIIAFLAVIIMGIGEAAFVSGSGGLNILSCSFLVLARYKSVSMGNKA